MRSFTRNRSPSIRGFCELLGPSAVLLPLPKSAKGPNWTGWERATFESTQAPAYQRRLADALRRGGNIGVLLGPASGNLCAIDVDTDDEVEPFLTLNSRL